MEPMHQNDLADYFDRTKAQQQRALAALGHRVARSSPAAGEEAEQGSSKLNPEREQTARADAIEMRGEAASEGAS